MLGLLEIILRMFLKIKCERLYEKGSYLAIFKNKIKTI
jgi:hypothetical protein